ncbi:MAG: class D beta-lactamase [Xanthomonadales bacterium]|nr:class D beta-lactamase [Xanthomonadales bacterium]
MRASQSWLSLVLLLLAAPAIAGGIAHNFNGRWGDMEIYDAESTLSFRVNLPRLSERVAPCSTFYIPAAVIALKSGLIKPAVTEISRAQSDIPPTHYWPSAWRAQKHNLRSAAENSVPWYLADITNKRGAVKLKADLAALKYGNADISGGLDGFWRSSSLRISGLEQVDFLRSVREGRVGLNRQQTQVLLDSLRLMSEGEHVLYGKTGSCVRGEDDLYGLFVGFVEQAGKPRAYFSLTVDGTSVADVATVRRQIVINSLIELGFWPAPPEPVTTLVADSGELSGTAPVTDAGVVVAAPTDTAESAPAAPMAEPAAVTPIAEGEPQPAPVAPVVEGD